MWSCLNMQKQAKIRSDQVISAKKRAESDTTTVGGTVKSMIAWNRSWKRARHGLKKTERAGEVWPKCSASSCLTISSGSWGRIRGEGWQRNIFSLCLLVFPYSVLRRSTGGRKKGGQRRGGVFFSMELRERQSDREQPNTQSVEIWWKPALFPRTQGECVIMWGKIQSRSRTLLRHGDVVGERESGGRKSDSQSRKNRCDDSPTNI